MTRDCRLALLAAALGGCFATPGDDCELDEPLGDKELLALEDNNRDCPGLVCLGLVREAYCTESCRSQDECPDGWMCMPMEPYEEGAYCVWIERPNEVSPRDPEVGTAMYHGVRAYTEAFAAWAPDAYLAELRSDTASVDGRIEEGSEWDYTFLAASKPDTRAVISVGVDGTVGELQTWTYHPEVGPAQTDIFVPDLWVFDSHLLRELAGPYGVEAFLAEHPDASAQYQLSGGILFSEPAAIWSYQLIDTGAPDMWSGTFNAASGGKLFF